MRILVVEESFETSELVSQILTEDGHLVTQAQWADDALELFRKTPFPIVVTEIAMRSMSGVDLMQQMKQINPDTEVIVLTSYASIDTAVSALRCGAYDYLIKPIEGISLISAAVNRTVEKIDLVTQNRLLIEQLRQENLELKEQNQKLCYSKAIDPVTGLYKPGYFHEALEMEIDRATKNQRLFSLILLDVAESNAADIQRALAECLRNNLRRSDLIAHYGDQGFALLLPETPRDGAQFVADKLVNRLQDLLWQQKFPNTVTVRVQQGVATYPEDGDDCMSLLQSCGGKKNPGTIR